MDDGRTCVVSQAAITLFLTGANLVTRRLKMRVAPSLHGTSRSAVIGDASITRPAPSGADLVIEDLDEFAPGTTGRFCALTNADYIFSSSTAKTRH